MLVCESHNKKCYEIIVDPGATNFRVKERATCIFEKAGFTLTHVSIDNKNLVYQIGGWQVGYPQDVQIYDINEDKWFGTQQNLNNRR